MKQSAILDSIELPDTSPITKLKSGLEQYARANRISSQLSTLFFKIEKEKVELLPGTMEGIEESGKKYCDDEIQEGFVDAYRAFLQGYSKLDKFLKRRRQRSGLVWI